MGEPPWFVKEDALCVATALEEIHDVAEPMEVLRLDDHTASIVVGVNGTDYILTMMKIPKQRKRSVQ